MSPVGDPALKLYISSTPLTKDRGFPLIVLETEGPREEQPHQGIKFSLLRRGSNTKHHNATCSQSHLTVSLGLSSALVQISNYAVPLP